VQELRGKRGGGRSDRKKAFKRARGVVGGEGGKGAITYKAERPERAKRGS